MANSNIAFALVSQGPKRPIEQQANPPEAPTQSVSSRHDQLHPPAPQNCPVGQSHWMQAWLVRSHLVSDGFRQSESLRHSTQGPSPPQPPAQAEVGRRQCDVGQRAVRAQRSRTTRRAGGEHSDENEEDLHNPRVPDSHEQSRPRAQSGAAAAATWDSGRSWGQRVGTYRRSRTTAQSASESDDDGVDHQAATLTFL